MGCCVADAVPSRGGRAILDTAEVVQFEIALEEAARADESGVGRFIEPAAGTLNRALSNRHHLVFGRRGSGKTSLLQKARSELIANRRPNAFIDMEKYKAHTYPDVLISVVIETFQAISSWLNDAAIAPATKRSVWQKVRPKRGPLKRSDSHDIAQLLDNHVGELRTLLFAEDGATVEMLRRGQWSREGHFSAGLNAGAPGASGNVEGGRSQSASELNETHESVTRSKIDFLHRRVIDFQVTLRKVVGLSDENGFILLDDLYYIRKADQPDVLDYFHRLFKGSGLWLKVGTIRHRSGWYRHGDPPVGMKLGDDVEEIDLDLTLEKYNTAKAFLQRIANEIAIDSSVSLNSLVNEGARDRLVLASGGVARDYLSILRKSIPVAREQGRKASRHD